MLTTVVYGEGTVRKEKKKQYTRTLQTSLNEREDKPKKKKEMRLGKEMEKYSILAEVIEYHEKII